MANNPNIFDADKFIKQVLSGKRDSFRFLVREYGLLVRGYLSTRVYHLSDAEDLAQETFLVAFKKLPDYQLGTNFRAWLLSIAKFHLNNYWRKNRRRADIMEQFRHDIAAAIEPEMNLASDDVKTTQINKLLDCIAKLPERSRHLIRSGLNGVRLEILSDEMNLKPNAIYQLRYRAHQLLKDCINNTSEGIPL